MRVSRHPGNADPIAKKRTLHLLPFEYNGPARGSREPLSFNHIAMCPLTRCPSNPARPLLVLLWVALCCMIVAAPLLVVHFPALAAMLYLFFAPICHQNPDRSFIIAGHALAVCHRCTGVYLGLLIGSLTPPLRLGSLSTPPQRRALVVCCTLPLLLDVALSSLGIWTNNMSSRFSTGLLFGAMLSTLLVSGIEELIDRHSWKMIRFQTAHVKGGIS